MKKLVPQVPNLNGTSKQALLDGYLEIIGYLGTAKKVMAENAPNGRDYQTVEPTRINDAMDAWQERYDALDTMQKEFEVAALAVHNAAGGR